MNLQQELARAIGGDTTSTVAALLRRLLTEDPPELAQWHPLGFIDIPLNRDRSTALRQREHATVHVWHPRLSRPQLPQHACHSHGWRLRSHVLHGRFNNETYHVTERPSGDHVLYEVSYNDGISRSVSTDVRVESVLARTDNIEAGTIYEIPRDAFHWTRQSTDDLVITAMMSSALSGQPPRNVRSRPCLPEYTYARAACSTAERTQIFESIIERIEG